MGLAFVVSYVVEELLGSAWPALKYGVSSIVGLVVYYVTRKWLRDLRDGV